MTGDATDRVRANTDPAALRTAERALHDRLGRLAGDPAALEDRAARLRCESDVERLLAANASVLVVTGAALALTAHRRFAVVPLVVGGFLLQHAVQGWCPPLPVLRRLGFRSRQEIDRELTAVKALRGDFAGVAGPEDALRAADR
jgi:hypothetical protein